ncbi:DUF3592 domain-containing protein [Streptomonospora sp. S1-112]|uniref:DUF3592 domain-containing protein n=1 Tax=Streptomonospora mangrovi TaxID=2883123 RepID=A0A9X3NNA6_9ACTN|nr:DUF3592 domain-containing protein [Streptomonospora mangrovi]MDA0563690.1 DUF3592 domain-containing protein [Streptomonospora mangrovi]
MAAALLADPLEAPVFHAVSAWLSDAFPYLLLLGSGTAFTWVGGAMLRRILWLRSKGVRVPGAVVERAVDQDPGEAPTYAAVFHFTTREGRMMRVRQSVSSSSNRLRVGQRVTVAYDPRDPARADIVEAGSQLTGAVLFTVAGVASVVGGAVLVVRDLL